MEVLIFSIVHGGIGVSESQLMLITGHVKLETVRKYAKTETSTVRALMETPRLDLIRERKTVESL